MNEGPAVSVPHLAQAEDKRREVREAGLGLPPAFPVSLGWPKTSGGGPSQLEAHDKKTVTDVLGSNLPADGGDTHL